MKKFKIKNVEEKKLIVACQICKFNKEISIENIWKYWSAFFSDDFVVDNKKLMMYKHRIVTSKEKAKAGKPMPDFCEEVEVFLAHICNWMIKMCDGQQDHKKNYEMFLDLLESNRKKQADYLHKLIRKNHLDKKGYRLINRSSKKHQLLLHNYSVFQGNKCLISAPYGKIKSYLINISKNEQ